MNRTSRSHLYNGASLPGAVQSTRSRALPRQKRAAVCYSDPPSKRLTGAETFCPRAIFRLVSVVLGVSVVTASLTFLVSVKTEQVQSGYAIFAAQIRAQELRQEQSALQVELSALKSPDRLHRVAQSKLDMHAPGSARTIGLGSSK